MFPMEKQDLIIPIVLIVVIGVGIWYELPRIDVKIEIMNIEATDTSKVIYVTKNLIHEARVSLKLSGSINGVDSPEYRSAKMNYEQSLGQLDELYALYPFSINCIVNITNIAKTPVSLRDIQMIGNLDNHNLMFKSSNYAKNSFKPGETITCIVTISTIDKESSISLYNMTNLKGDLSISSKFKARLKTRKIVDTQQISYNIPE